MRRFADLKANPVEQLVRTATRSLTGHVVKNAMGLASVVSTVQINQGNFESGKRLVAFRGRHFSPPFNNNRHSSKSLDYPYYYYG